MNEDTDKQIADPESNKENNRDIWFQADFKGKMNAWQEYKKKLGETRPWDTLNPKNYTDEDTARKRINICEGCSRYRMQTRQCRECGCLMILKTKLTDAVCPIGKW